MTSSRRRRSCESARAAADLGALLVQILDGRGVRACSTSPFDMQLIGGMILRGPDRGDAHGRGQDLVSALPAFLNALSRKGVRRGGHLAACGGVIGRIHKFLGLSCGLIQAGMSEEERRDGYGSDVTYVTNSELGSATCRTTWRRPPRAGIPTSTFA